MLGKNNFKERLRKMEEQNKRERFSIRKLSIGAASVLIGFAFMGLSSSTVLADPLVPASEPQTAKSETDNQGNNVPEETPKFAGNGMQNNDQTGTAAQSNKKNSQAPAANEQNQSEHPAQPAKNNVGQPPAKTGQESKAGQNLNRQADTTTDQTAGSATDQATQSKPDTASNKSKTLDEAVASLQKAMDQASDYEEKIEANQSLTDVQKKQLAQIDDAMMSGQALLDKYNAKKLEGQTIAGIVRSNHENSDNRGHGSGLQGFDLNQFGDLAGQLGGLLNSFLYVPGQATQDVNNWSDLRSAIEDDNVTTINLSSDIITSNDLSYGVHNRSLVINGNNHTLTVNNRPLLNFTGNVFLKNINISIGSGSSLFNQPQKLYGNPCDPAQLTFMGNVTVINPKGLAAHDIVLSEGSTLNMEYVGSAGTDPNQRNDLWCNNLTLEKNSTLNDGSDTARADNGSIDVAKDINVAAGANLNVNSVGRDIQFSFLATTDNKLNVTGSVNLKSTSSSHDGSINGWGNIIINVEKNGKLNIDIPDNSFWDKGIGGPLNLNAKRGSTVTITEKGQAKQPLRITADNPKLFDLKASNTGFSHSNPLQISSDSKFIGKNVGILLKTKERSGAWKIRSIDGTIGSGTVDPEDPEGIKFSTPVTPVEDIPSRGLASSNFGLSPASWYSQLGSNHDFSEIKMTSDISNFGVDTDAKRFDATSSTVILHVKDSLQVSTGDVLHIKDNEGNIGDISTSSNWPGTSDKILKNIKWVDGKLYNNQGIAVGEISASGNITLNSGVIDFAGRPSSDGNTDGTAGGTANILVTYEDGTTDTVPVQIDLIGGYSVPDSDATTLNRGEDLTTSAAKTAVKNLVANNGDLDQFNATYAWATGSDGPDVTTSSNGKVKHAKMVISYFKDAAHTEADGTQTIIVPYKVQDNTENDSTKPTVNSDGLTVHYGQVVTPADAIGMIKLGNSTTYLTPSEVGTGHTVTDVQWVTSLTNGTVIIPNTDQATAGQGSTDVAGYIKVTYIDGSSKILAAGIHVHAGYNNTDKSYTLTSGTQPSDDDAKNAIKNSAAGAIDSLSGYNVSYKWAKDADGTAMDDAYVTSPTNVKKHAWVVITYTDGVGARAHTATQIVQVNDLSIKSQANSYTINEITGGLNSHAVASGSPDVGHLKSYFTVLGGTDGTTDESSNVTSVVWKSGDEPNWTTAGDKTGTVTLTFADGSTKDVTLDVHLVGANVLDTTESTYRNVVPTEAEAKGKVTNAVGDLDQYHATYGWYSDAAATTALTASDVATATVAGTPKIVYLAVKYYKDAAHTEADGQQVITMQLTINNSSSQYTASLNDTSTTLRTHVNAPSTDFTNWSDWITLKKTSDSSTIDLSTIGTASNPIRSIEWATAPNTAESADSSQTAVAKITFADSTLTDPDVLEVNVPVTVAKATAKSDIETNHDSPLTAKDEISNLITLNPTTGEFKVGDSDVTWASDNTGSALASDFWTTNSDSSTAVDPVSGTRTSGKKGAYLIVHYKKSDGSSNGTQAIWVAVKIKSDADNIGGVTFDTAHGNQVTTHANATSADNNAENKEEVPSVHQELVIYIGKDGQIVKKAYITVGKGYQSLEQLLKLAQAKDKMPRGYKATGKARKVAKHLYVWVSKSGQSGNKKAPRTKDVLYVTKDGKIVKRTRITGSVSKQAKQHLPKGYKMTGLSRVHNHYDIWVKKSRKQKRR